MRNDIAMRLRELIAGEYFDSQTEGSVRDAAAEIERLQAENERLHRDRRDLLEQLRHIRTHLYAATVQRSPSDDRIIADHVEQAYLRAAEVIKTVEKRDE